MSHCEFRPLKSQLDAAGIHLVAIENNLVDIVWDKEKPSRPTGSAMPLELKYTGERSCLLSQCQMESRLANWK